MNKKITLENPVETISTLEEASHILDSDKNTKELSTKIRDIIHSIRKELIKE